MIPDLTNTPDFQSYLKDQRAEYPGQYYYGAFCKARGFETGQYAEQETEALEFIIRAALKDAVKP